MQEMELTNILGVFRRRMVLLVTVPVVCVLALLLGLRASPAAYEAGVKLQLSTPQREDVAVFDEYRSISLRDEITVASNNFAQVLQSNEVRNRTITQLALQERDQVYELSVSPDRDSDFINVTVQASAADLAARIADTHVAAAISYYGELRARPINAEADLFAEELRTAEQEFSAAENAYAEFQADYGIGSLEQAMATQQRLLEQLKLERDQRILVEISRGIDPVGEVETLISWRQEELKRLLALVPTYEVLSENAQRARQEYIDLVAQSSDPTIASTSAITDGVVGAVPTTQSGEVPLEIQVAEEQLRTAENLLNEFKAQNGIVTLDDELTTHGRLLEQLRLERDRLLLEETTRAVDPLDEVERLIAERQAELDRLTALVPRYDVLVENAEQARDAYQRILSKYTEAELKAATVRAANFIQVVQPALSDNTPVSDLKKLLIIVAVGSVGLGLLLAFLLEYLSVSGPARVGALTRGAKAPAPEGQEAPSVPNPSELQATGQDGDLEALASDTGTHSEQGANLAFDPKVTPVGKRIRDLRGLIAGRRIAGWILVVALALVLLVYGSESTRTEGATSASVPADPRTTSPVLAAPTASILTTAVPPASTPALAVTQVANATLGEEPLLARCMPPEEWMIYVVRGSDTLISLASRYEVSVTEILQANCMTEGEISQFQTLYLPPLPNTPTPAPRTITTISMTPTVALLSGSCAPPEGWTTIHVVRAGDSLYSLALAFGVSVDEIVAANCLESTFLSAGRQQLYLPPLPEGRSLPPARTAPLTNPSTNSPTLAVDADTTSLPAPALVSPADGSEFAATADVVLSWRPVPGLPPDAYYAVTVAYSHLGETWFDDVPWTRNTDWTLSEHKYLLDLVDDGEFRWSVQVVRQVGFDADGAPVDEALSESSDSRTLNWKRPSEGGGRAPAGTPPVPPP